MSAEALAPIRADQRGSRGRAAVERGLTTLPFTSPDMTYFFSKMAYLLAVVLHPLTRFSHLRAAQNRKGYYRATATTRKPYSSSRRPGAAPTRVAERRRMASLNHEPPRITRYSESFPLNHAEPSVGAPL